jgi:hypothetical protein
VDLIKRFKRELPNIKSGFSCICAGIGALFSLILMVACGNFHLYKLLLLPRHAPPALLFFLIFLLCGAMIGYTVGLIYCYSKCGRVLFPLLFALLSFVFLALWYISFFKSFAFLFGLFLLFMALFMAILALKECIPAGILPTVFMGVCLLPLLFFIWMTFAVVILN